MFDSFFSNDRIKGSKVHPTRKIEIKNYFRSSKLAVPAPITSKIDKRNNRLVIGTSYYYFYTKQSFLFTTSYPGNYIIKNSPLREIRIFQKKHTTTSQSRINLYKLV